MEILEIPFHNYLNIERSENKEYLFQAKERPEYLNHIGTIHACVQLTLAEASSGEFLTQEFSQYKTSVIPVVRKTEAKYHRPANGILYSKATFVSDDKLRVIEELESKKRATLKIKVEIFDKDKNKALTAIFDWFLTKS